MGIRILGSFLFCFIGLSLSRSDGEWVNVNVEFDLTKKLANRAVRELEQKSNALFQHRLLSVTRAQSQIDSGGEWFYRFSFEWGMTECRKDDSSKPIESCTIKQVQNCTVILHVPPSLMSADLTYSQCSPYRTYKDSRLLFGGGDDHDKWHYGMFSQFKEKYGKQYATPEDDMMRFKIFQQNMQKARKIQDTEQGTGRYGASKFIDLTEEEFRQNYLTPKWNQSYNPFLKPAKIPTDPIPDAFDWRDHNAVTPVKNQQSCGSCWAFSTTGNIEGQWAIHKGQLVSLSEQELVDCDKLDLGCNGGLPSNAYQEIIRLGGLEGEKDYPYDARTEKCHFDKSDVRVTINSAVNISSNEADMAAWLVKNSPISIGINAFAMQFYLGGVSHPWSFFCNPADLDHGVLIVGYGIHKGWFSPTPFWAVKNSWGEDWGEKGYYLVYRGGGVCGLNTMATSAIVA